MSGFTRRGAMGTGLAAGALLPAAAGGQGSARPDASKWILWYRQPAEKWVEALPIGNGRLGAMVFGGAATERLQLNEDSLWAGRPYDPSSPTALASLPEVRRLIFAGRHAEAQALAERDLMGRPLRQMPYQTLGDLLLEMRSKAKPGDYRRWLDLDSAEAVTEWSADGRRYRRTAYASAADQAIMVKTEPLDDRPLDAAIRFSSPGGTADGGTLWLEGRNGGANGVEGGLRYAMAVRVLAPGGTVSAAGELIAVAGASSITLLIAARTSYRNWQAADLDPVAAVHLDLDRAAALSEALRLARHRREHRRLFHGFDIDLGRDPFPATPTDERIRRSQEPGRDDPFLAALYVQYGRYLLICSSRPGTQPANLQGLWNDSNDPPWGCKYTININTEMNYWPAEPLGLGGCVEPLIRLVEDLAVSGARTASVNYGARGWVAHHNTDLWRATAAVDGAFWGLWPTGGAWLCKHLWDRWDYSRDPAALRRIYPLIRDAGLFFLDTLVEHPDGSGLVTSPSLSPENAHKEGVSLCAGPAMDRQILRELFGNIVTASALLKRDRRLRRQFAAAARRLPGDRIGKAGQLQEWLEDWDMEAPERQHRHVSHLFALHPGHEIGPETPALYRAARRSLEIRGDDATGWGIGWRINLWARLGDGARAYRVLKKLLGPDRSYPNLFDAHPPFQIDGNFGGDAGIVEMLVRERPQGIELLPALPPEWKTGRLTGVRLRGGAELDLIWSGEAVAARFKADRSIRRKLTYRERTEELEVRAGAAAVFKG